MFLGPPGTGKTHLAIGLAIRACQAGHRVAVRHRRRMGRPPRRRPPRRPPASRAGPARPLPAARRRRGRLHPLRTRSREPVLPARLLPLRTSQPDRHQQQAVRPLGRGLRRRRRRRRHDRPPRPPRRSHRPQRRLLPAQRPRPRPRPRGHHRGTMTNQGVKIQPAPEGQFSAGVDTLAASTCRLRLSHQHHPVRPSSGRLTPKDNTSERQASADISAGHAATRHPTCQQQHLTRW